MAVREFDEINKLTKETTWRSIPYSKYFGEMELTDEQKKERQKLAEEIEDIIMYIFALILSYKQYETVTGLGLIVYSEMILYEFKAKYTALIASHADIIDIALFSNYIDTFTSDYMQTTLDNLDNELSVSGDRAIYTAENESNTIYNTLDYQRAISAGKTKKKWIAMKDNRVRLTHAKVDEKTIAIDKPFVVGDSLMNYPKDSNLGADAKEIVNCRCSIKYF